VAGSPGTRTCLTATGVLLAFVGACGAGGGHPDSSRPARDQSDAGGEGPVERDAAPPTDGPEGDDGPLDAAAAVSTDAAARDAGRLMFEPWPGTGTVVAIDRKNQLGMNVSGLSYLSGGAGQPAALLAVQNTPSRLYRLIEGAAGWGLDPASGWAAGKDLHYPNGKGSPDAEGVTSAGGAVYVSAEQDNDRGVSRLSVLRFDTAGAATSLTATHEWDLTAELPVVDANLGLEAIAWIPDDHLVARGFLDESTGQPYQPAAYPDHGGGVILVGLEPKGTVFAYALDHTTRTAHRLATFSSGQFAIMDLAFDPDLGALWAACDDHCSNRVTLLAIDADPASATRGRFVVRRGFDRPSTLPNTNNEGITFAPAAACAGGQRRFFWADDSALDGQALRLGSIPCGPLF
jgi:hypothetical protein